MVGEGVYQEKMGVNQCQQGRFGILKLSQIVQVEASCFYQYSLIVGKNVGTQYWKARHLDAILDNPNILPVRMDREDIFDVAELNV